MFGTSKFISFNEKIYDLVESGGGKATAVTIAEALLARTGKEPNMARIYESLDAMKKRGAITLTWGPATRKRGGRRKAYYSVTNFDEVTDTEATK